GHAVPHPCPTFRMTSRHATLGLVPGLILGLESVKKTEQVADVGEGLGAPRPVPFNRDPTGQAYQHMAMPMAQRMKRLGTPIAAVFGLALIAMIASSWLINRDALRQAVEAQIRAVTGLDLTVKGPINVSVFPGSYVSFHDVGLKGSANDEPALRV